MLVCNWAYFWAVICAYLCNMLKRQPVPMSVSMFFSFLAWVQNLTAAFLALEVEICYSSVLEFMYFELEMSEFCINTHP